MIKKTRLSNVMGTPLALVVLVTIPSFVLYGFTKYWVLLIIAFIPVAYFIRAFDYIMKHDPNLLRTEEHEEKMLAIRTGAMGQKDNTIPAEVIEELPAVVASEVPVKPQKNKKLLEDGNE